LLSTLDVFSFSCDFNKYTMNVIKKMSQSKLREKEMKSIDDDDEELLMRGNDDESDSEKMSDEDEKTSEE
jgi:hypothetical protein